MLYKFIKVELGVSIVKIYKQKDKLVVYLPFEVVKGLNLSDTDEVDFFKVNENTFIFAKKADVASLLLSGDAKKQAQTKAQPERKSEQSRNEAAVPSQDEMTVLKKLDTLRYDSRDPESVNKMLSEREKEILKGLVGKKIVSLFRKERSGKELYSISKYIYDRFLMRKKVSVGQALQKQEQKSTQKSFVLNISGGMPENENLKTLQKEGFVVVQTEGEASALSIALQDSIRRGLVLGTRAFNKKFYVLLRQFFDMYSTQIIKELKQESELRVPALAKNVGVNEEGARAILYLLAEAGDVTEKRRDLFTLA